MDEIRVSFEQWKFILNYNWKYENAADMQSQLMSEFQTNSYTRLITFRYVLELEMYLKQVILFRMSIRNGYRRAAQCKKV